MSSLKTIVRVYGILQEEEQILLCREKIKGDYYTKFPGGGLEYGEGIHDCLIREFKEETSAEIAVGELFYINPDFVPSAFHENLQVLSLYYKVKLKSGKAQDLLSREDDLELMWVPLQEISVQTADLYVDRAVIGKILQEFYSSR